MKIYYLNLPNCCILQLHLYDGICCNRIQLFSIKIQGKNWIKKDLDTTQDKQQNAVAIFHLVTGYDCLGDIA
ncbi:hypothetical protein TNCT_552791 [Trichonephila clavata]|uniref:Uncharacterized protein n=1 Tax=Trichonephila clavata TaxID=2740835 RepID=A0A8X6HFK7_TRICU|nr:hypothetical protein TNCT_552791 [Trichonephila clavata]